MNSKTKLTLTITVMVMVTLIAIVGIIAVFAARTQNFSSNISVKYTATQIVGKVSAKYYVGPTDTSGTAMTTTGKEGGETELVFKPGGKQLDPNTLNPLGDIVLDVEDTVENIPDKSWVVFEYVFQNGLDTPATTDYRATLTYTGSSQNIDITTLASDVKLSSSQFSTIRKSVSSPNNFTSIMELDRNTSQSGAAAVKYFYIKAAIHDISTNSEFSGNFDWNLSVISNLEKLKFTPKDNGYAVSQADEYVGGDIVIPSSYTGTDGISKPVIEISVGAFADNCNITGVEIPNVEIVGEGAFADCEKLKTATVAGGIIDTVAFVNCENLTTITIGENVERIEIGAFGVCESVNMIFIESRTIYETCSDESFGELFYYLARTDGQLWILEDITYKPENLYITEMFERKGVLSKNGKGYVVFACR